MGGIISLLKSRKFWIAVVGVGGVVLSESFGWEAAAVESLTGAIVVIAGILIAAIAVEDAADKSKGNNPGEWK